MPSWRRLQSIGAFSLLLVRAVSTAVSAQSFNGAIVGVVKDSTGAVVTDTALTLRNMANDQTLAAVSGADAKMSG